MPDKETLKRVRRDKAEGKSASTQAGEFIREEVHHVRAGKHGARSAKQVIAIGLAKARRAGVKLAPPKPGTTSLRTQRQAVRDAAKGRSGRAQKPSPRRSRAATRKLKQEDTVAASPLALARHSKSVAKTKRKKAR
jgi:hypothetical protein